MTMQNDPHAAFIESARALKNRIAEHRSFDRLAAVVERSQRSVQTCHRFKAERPRRARPTDSGAYVPELAALLDSDPNLCDGARRCARKIAEETYRQNREGRSLAVTVTYLARGLGRCRRTVQRYLRQLEDGGYIAVDVVTSGRTRLCIGLLVQLCGPLFARHHRKRWPGALENPGATAKSRNQSSRINRIMEAGDDARIPILSWAVCSMNGVFVAFMKTNPLGRQSSIAFA